MSEAVCMEDPKAGDVRQLWCVMVDLFSWLVGWLVAVRSIVVAWRSDDVM